MRNVGLFGLALLATSALSAPAAFAGDLDFTVEGFAAQTTADAEFINADKLPNEISGTFTGVRLGVEYAFGESSDGLFVGLNYSTTIGDGINSPVVRNGNYLTHETTLEGFEGWEVVAGWDFGPIALGVGYTPEFTRDVVSYQSCPEDSDAVPFGYCGNATFRQQREGLRGGSPEEDATESIRWFGRYDVSDRVAITLSYQQADFGQSVSPLDVIPNAENNAAGNRTAHGPTSFAQDFEILSIGAQLRF